MCILHARIAKKYVAEFESLRLLMGMDMTDDVVYKLKYFKQKATDDCIVLHGCPAVDKYLKYLQAPTPPKRNMVVLQNHVDDLIKALK